ncbi:UDP-glucuronate 4-epimerase [Pycnococcus provasolii]
MMSSEAARKSAAGGTSFLGVQSRTTRIVMACLALICLLYLTTQSSVSSAKSLTRSARLMRTPIDYTSAHSSCGRTDDDKMIVLVTGAAGFVGMHTSLTLKASGHGVLGLDNFNDYYPVPLKRARQKALLAAGVYVAERDLADEGAFAEALGVCAFTHVLHLAAQAGVRYAVVNPQSYVRSNLMGFVEVMEAVRHLDKSIPVVYASSSSVYGLNTKQPFSEEDRVDSPASLYAATKKSNEVMAHAYWNIYGLSLTGLRFFTVYGPFGRPDMAYFSFTKAVLAGSPIKVFQNPADGGELSRDFTYIDDIVHGCIRSLETSGASGKGVAKPPRIFNLGNTQPTEVSVMVNAIEKATGRKAIRKFVPMPATGDVVSTFADVDHARTELGYSPSTGIEEGISKFVTWYLDYYGPNGYERATPEELAYKGY